MKNIKNAIVTLSLLVLVSSKLNAVEIKELNSDKEEQDFLYGKKEVEKFGSIKKNKYLISFGILGAGVAGLYKFSDKFKNQVNATVTKAKDVVNNNVIKPVKEQYSKMPKLTKKGKVTVAAALILAYFGFKRRKQLYTYLPDNPFKKKIII